MSRKVTTRGGKILKSHTGGLRRVFNSSAPNDKNFGVVEARIANESSNDKGYWYVKVGNIPANVSLIRLQVLYLEIGTGEKIAYHTNIVPISQIDTWVTLGEAPIPVAAVANSLSVAIEPVVNNIPGRGTRIPTVTQETTPPQPDVFPSFSVAPSFTSALVESTAFTYNPGTVINATPDTIQTITFYRSDSSDGASPTLITPGGVVGADGNKYYKIRNTLTDPILQEPVIGESGWTLVAASAVVVTLGTPPSFTSATLTEGIAFTKNNGTVINATDSTTVTISYEQSEDNTATSGTALTPTNLVMPTSVLTYARIKRVVEDPSLAPITLTDYSTWKAVINLPNLSGTPAFTSSLTEGTAFTKTDAVGIDLTESSEFVTIYEDNTTAEDAGAASLSVIGLTLPASVNNFVKITQTLTDPLLIEAGVTRTASSAWTACANAPAVAPSIPIATFAVTVSAYTGIRNFFRPQIASFSSDQSDYEYEWTTSVLSPVPAGQTENLQKVGAIWQTQMDDVAARVDPNTQTQAGRTDYSVFEFTGSNPYVLIDAKGDKLRFRRRRNLGGGSYSPWSEWSPQTTVPVPASVVTSEDWPKRWMPMPIRSAAEKAAKGKGGAGKQFLRSYGTSRNKPHFILAGMDQNMQWASDDDGETWYTPAWNGMQFGRQTQSVWVDDEDGNRQIAVTCTDPGGLRNGGVFLSKDGGKTCTIVLGPLDYVRGTNTKRHNYQSVCAKPGLTAASRHIFYLFGKASSAGSAIASLQLYRSTNGGDNFSARGSALSVSTYCNGNFEPYEIAFNPAGTLMHMCGPNGSWWSDDDGLTWTKCTGLPSGPSHHIEYQANGTAWIGTDAGLYTSVVGKAFTQKANFGNVQTVSGVSTVRTVAAGGAPDVNYFGIAKTDSNYIVAAQEGFRHPIYSTDGGTSWTVGFINPRPGQEYVGAETLGQTPSGAGGLVNFPSSKERWFAMSGQHVSISDDHGQTFNHGGFFYDGRHTRGTIGFNPDPAKWDHWLYAQQDAVSVATVDGGLSYIDDRFGAPGTTYSDQVKTAIGSPYVSAGGVILTENDRAVFHGGQSPGPKLPIVEHIVGGSSISNPRILTNLTSSISDFAFLDPNNSTRGWLGQYRVGNLDGAADTDVTFTSITKLFATGTGAGGSTVIYGVDGGSSSKVIYRSTNGGDSWTTYVTATGDFRPVDTRPCLVADPNSNARLYALAVAKVVRFSGTSSPTETTVFNLADYYTLYPYLANYESKQTRSFAVDPKNPNLGYVSLYMWGCPNVFRTQNLLSATPTWESIATDDADGLPHVAMELNIHPHTSDLYAYESHGIYVCKPPSGHNTTYGITHSVWDTQNAYLKTTQ